jgi:hypothetical protein
VVLAAAEMAAHKLAVAQELQTSAAVAAALAATVHLVRVALVVRVLLSFQSQQ